MEGYLFKKGKRYGSRVKRYMRLDGDLLTNHHDKSSPSTWAISVKDATISGSGKRKKIVIDLYANRMELFAETGKDTDLWLSALAKAKAKDVAVTGNPIPDRPRATGERQSEGGVKDPGLIEKRSSGQIPDSVGTADAEPEKPAEHRRLQLNKSFKVVKPVIRQIDSYASDESEDYGRDENEDGAQPANTNGAIYEETPASMIFKQFNYKGAK